MAENRTKHVTVNETYQRTVGLFQSRLPKDQSDWCREDYINSCLPMVIDLAVKYAEVSGVDVNDLVSEGNLGLLQAWEKFDPSKGTKFSSYAWFWARAYIIKLLEKENKWSKNIMVSDTLEEEGEDEDFE